MKAGEAFGETSLMHDKPLTESILCNTDAHFATLSKKKFEEILKTIEMKTKSGWKAFFRTHPIFDTLTLVTLEKLFYLIELKIFQRNQTIFKEGDEVKGFYLVYKGEVGLTKIVSGKVNVESTMKRTDSHELFKAPHNTRSINTFSKEHELRILGEGQLLGVEDALIKRSKNTKNYFTNS